MNSRAQSNQMDKNDELPREEPRQLEPTQNNQIPMTNLRSSITIIPAAWHSAKSTIDESLVSGPSHDLSIDNFSAVLEASSQHLWSTHLKTQIWLNNLRSPSSITSEWNTVNSTIDESLVYEPRHELPMIGATEDNQIFFLDGETGKKCLLVGARNLKIRWGNTPPTMKWTFREDSRFSEVALLQDVWCLDIKCKIETQMLSQETFYGAHLLFKLGNPIFGLESVGGVVRLKDRESGSDSAKKAFLLHLHQGFPVDKLIRRETGRFPVRREDGWMEIELGDFYNDKGDNGKVEARLMEIKRLHKKGGLIVEGVEFRPKTFFNRSILLSDIEPNFFEDEKCGKKCAVVGARELVIEWAETPKKWIWTRPTDSRFLEVAQLKRVHWLDVKCKIETRMLLPATNYGAYLVFKLATVFHGLESVKGVVRFMGRESGKDAEKRASHVHLHMRRYPSPLETGRFAVTREDGWMEVELGDFYVHQGDDDEVEARLLDIWTLDDKKSGLIVEAIEFRPK